LIISDATVDLEARLDHRRRMVGPDARCAICGMSWTLVLFRRPEAVSCFGCAAIARGRTGFELHHLGGKSSPYTVLIPVNVHVVLTAAQVLSWRGVHEPGSPEAIARDVLAFIIVGAAYLEEMER
jgi:hypothetical protein